MPLAQQRQGLRETHLVIEFSKTNHVAAAATSEAVKQVLVRVDQEAWSVFVVQRTQPHPSATAEPPGRAPIVSLQIIQQRSLLF